MDDSLAAVIVHHRLARPYRSWQDFARRTQLSEAVIQELKLIFSLHREQHLQGSCSTRILNNGSDERIRSHIHARNQLWSAQWTLQRDPGEYNLSDLSAFSFSIQRGNTTLFVGSQRVEWGLGLALSKVYTPRRGTALLRPARDIMRIRPGYSNLASGAIRGVSVAAQLGHLRFVAGTGLQKADVTLTPDGTPEVVAHRTHSHPSSQQIEVVPWLGISTSLKQAVLGVFAGEQRLIPDGTLPGSRAQLVSLVLSNTYVVSAGIWRFRHEEAWQSYMSRATPGSDPMRATQSRAYFDSRTDSSGKRIRLVLIYRAYPHTWEPLRGQLFGRHVSNGNERGLYLGWEWSRGLFRLTGHMDYYNQIIPITGPWSHRGWESGLGASLGGKSRQTRISYRRKGEHVGASAETPDGLTINTDAEHVTDHLSVTYSGNLGRRLAIRVHTARTMNVNGSGSGNVFGSALRYTTRFMTSVAAGAYLFRTDGWDRRMVIYEAGLPREFNLTPLYGSGIRIHGLISIPLEKGTLSIRAAREWKEADADNETAAGALRIGIQIDIAL